MSTTPHAETLGQLRSLFTAAQLLELSRFEESSGPTVANELSPWVIRLLVQALTLSAGLLAAFGGDETAALEASEIEEFELEVDRLLVAARPPRLGRLSLVVFTELQTWLRRLEGHRPELDPMELLAECSTALRRLRKSLAALEVLLCRLTGFQRRITAESELATSLRVRRHFAKLWRYATPQLSGEGVEKALRGAAARCAALLGDERLHLHVRERQQLRDLRERILDWARTSSDPRLGVPVWAQFQALATALRDVNRRRELLSHDVEALRLAESALLAGGPGALEEAIPMLRRVEGLDDALDAVRSSEVVHRDVLLELTRRVHARRLAAQLELDDP